MSLQRSIQRYKLFRIPDIITIAPANCSTNVSLSHKNVEEHICPPEVVHHSHFDTSIWYGLSKHLFTVAHTKKKLKLK